MKDGSKKCHRQFIAISSPLPNVRYKKTAQRGGLNDIATD
ncbi:hypothetical protein L585_21345 [Pantoea ananatis BRT175]|nr:hypothetical protein L585_21345 [Pantoea ananatis BRT175]